MKKLKICPECKTYTLKENCSCGEKTSSAHHKFIKVNLPKARPQGILKIC